MVYFSQKFLTAVRCGDYKLHYMTKDGMGGTPVTQDPPLLFNVRTNPRENLPLTAESFPLYNQVIDGLNAYKANFVENLVPGPPQFELYNKTVGAYQPCCNPNTTPPCYCPPAGMEEDLVIMKPQIEKYYAMISKIIPEELLIDYSS